VDRRLARKNVRTGVMLGALALFLFAFTFVVAAIYLA
jgi:hypothetical protein